MQSTENLLGEHDTDGEREGVNGHSHYQQTVGGTRYKDDDYSDVDPLSRKTSLITDADGGIELKTLPPSVSTASEAVAAAVRETPEDLDAAKRKIAALEAQVQALLAKRSPQL